ncbi:hypothetical protein [Cellulomonas dongxiuzhuiae]|uniref:hypothetical protein n=1 Tax=Cellulomonas dongxiuzhuiae TaxID=2819979 RepID=UPI001AAF17BF|nr:hypothetical protein [Cellulomonas dongxiuzhuiae]MBO3090107.1 hypothetical protein [Cellulomonas dongxiuzhuiae]
MTDGTTGQGGVTGQDARGQDARGQGARGQGAAVIDVRVLPWRPKRRVKDLGVDLVSLGGGADLLGVVVSTVVAIIAALVVLVFLVSLVVVLLELWIVALVALALVLARFAGLLPWVVDTGRGTFERYRWLPHATRRVRELNGGGPARMRWRWI